MLSIERDFWLFHLNVYRSFVEGGPDDEWEAIDSADLTARLTSFFDFCIRDCTLDSAQHIRNAVLRLQCVSRIIIPKARGWD